MAGIVPIKYRAFLSYSHRDKAWGKWLHRVLEDYRIDKDLVGRETPVGPVPKMLRPIFRDRDDFSAGHSLSEQTLAALEVSQFLIVLCSPNAAQSKYVNEEIRRFKLMGRSECIIPVIVGGQPGDPANECFPPALRSSVGPEGGAAASEGEEPLAADLRPEGDGKEIAKLKVVAGVLGLRLDEIIQRAARARRRQNRFWAGLAGVFLLLAVAATGSALFALQQLKTNEAFLDATLKRATDIVSSAVVQAEKYNVPRSATLEFLAKAEGLFDDMARFGVPTPELRYRKALMWVAFAENYKVLGRTDKRRASAMEAHRLLQKLVDENPNHSAWQNDLSVTFQVVGDVLKDQGELDAALASYRTGLVISGRLAAADPAQDGHLFNVAGGLLRIGDVYQDQGTVDEALRTYREALDIAFDRLKVSSNDPRWVSTAATLDGRVGTVFQRKGNLEAALKFYRFALDLSRLLAEGYPTSTNQGNLAGSYLIVGGVLREQGDLDAALASYREAVAISKRLTENDPTNVIWLDNLLAAQDGIGDVFVIQGMLAVKMTSRLDELAQNLSVELWVLQGKRSKKTANHSEAREAPQQAVVDDQDKLSEALQSYRASLAIRERLVAADPTNMSRLSELADSHLVIGDVLFVQKQFDESIVSYQASLAVRERLVTFNPTNTNWLYNLALLHNRVANVLQTQGRVDDALQNYRESNAIAERVAAADPQNVDWQVMAIMSNLFLAWHEADPVRVDSMVLALRELKDENKLKPAWHPMLSFVEEVLAKLQAR